MRSCIYCGRELEKGEVCGCPQSAAARAKREAANQASAGKTDSGTNNAGNGQANTGSNSYYSQSNDSSYRTGYTKKENRVKQAWQKAKMKYTGREKSRTVNEMREKGFWRNLFAIIIKFFKSPVDAVTNPGNITKATAAALAMINGVVCGLCLYFVKSGARRGIFSLSAAILGFKGMAGYGTIMNILLSMVSGLIGGVLLFMLYAGIFLFICRFVFRKKTVLYRDIFERLSVTLIPMTVICAFGILISMVSPYTLAMLLCTGVIIMSVLTYEAMRTELIEYSASKVLYSVALGIFIFAGIVNAIIISGIR